jgi:outer membrane protein OmpA-like peptidoglycan-associated protein
MTNFGKKSLTWLVVGSLVAAGGGVAWRVASVGAQQAQEALRQVERSEADLANLKTRLAKWLQTHDLGDAADQGKLGALQIEPVALTADFSPKEFAGIDSVLSGMYTENGSLNLKSFILETGAGGTAHITLLGDKIFSPKRPPPPDRIVLLPNADGSPSAVILKTAVGEQVIDHPYQAASVTQDGAITPRKESAESVKARYGAVLAAQPKRPASYTVYFVSGKNEITPESQAVLEKVKADLKTRNVPEILVIGHTDRVGKLEANDALSLARAKVMRDILIATGIPAKLIQTAGRGEREPIVQTADQVPEAKNRRVEISVR